MDFIENKIDYQNKLNTKEYRLYDFTYRNSKADKVNLW